LRESTLILYRREKRGRAKANPDELVWKHLKADPVGRISVTRKEDFETKVRSSTHQLQNNLKKILSFYQKPCLRYAA
jgi:hypothetical protein